MYWLFMQRKALPNVLQKCTYYHKNFCGLNNRKTSFFQNKEIFVQLDKLDKFNRITHAWIGFNYSLKQAQKTV